MTISISGGMGDINSLGIPKKPPQRPKSPPMRPPLPGTPKHVPKAGVISIPAAARNTNQDNPVPALVPQRPAPPVIANPYQQQSCAPTQQQGKLLMFYKIDWKLFRLKGDIVIFFRRFLFSIASI